MGKMIGGVVSNWDVNDFQPIACEFFPVLSDEALCDVSNDQYYAYQICWSIIHRALDPDLQLLEVGPLCHSRWLSLGWRILRYYVSQDEPNLTLVLFSGVRRISLMGVSVTSHRDDVSFSDVTAIIMP